MRTGSRSPSARVPPLSVTDAAAGNSDTREPWLPPVPDARRGGAVGHRVAERRATDDTVRTGSRRRPRRPRHGDRCRRARRRSEGERRWRRRQADTVTSGKGLRACPLVPRPEAEEGQRENVARTRTDAEGGARERDRADAERGAGGGHRGERVSRTSRKAEAEENASTDAAAVHPRHV